MGLIDQIMLYAVFALAGLVLVLMAIWAWLETSVGIPAKARRTPKPQCCCRREGDPL